MEQASRDLVQLCYEVAEERGFHQGADRQAHVTKQLLHAFIELGEVADHWRKRGEIDTEEIADVCIVLFDLLGVLGYTEVEWRSWVTAKCRRNAVRPYRYGVRQ